MQFYGDLNLAIEEIIHLPLVYGNNFYHDARMACREIYFEQEGVFENQYKPFLILFRNTLQLVEHVVLKGWETSQIQIKLVLGNHRI